MTKLNIILALILIASALSIVTSRHQARVLFVALENEQKIARQIDVQWGRLQLEQRTLAMHERIEKIASEKLNMKAPIASRIHILTAKQPADWINLETAPKP